MTITIKKGNHSPNLIQRLAQFGIHHDLQKMERVVEFDITAKYDHPGTYDDEDVNKLFGFGYMKGGHHEDSARVGWLWDVRTGKPNFMAYCYVNKERIIQPICEVFTNFKFLPCIEIINKRYQFSVYDAKNDYKNYGRVEIPFTHDKTWSYQLGAFFGGQPPAPHDITIKISRK